MGPENHPAFAKNAQVKPPGKARTSKVLPGAVGIKFEQEIGSVAMAKYQVELTIVKVPVPKDELPIWKQSVANLYARLEDMVQQDKERLLNAQLQSGSQNIDSFTEKLGI